MVYNCAEIMKALSEPNRRRIVRALLTEPRSVRELSQALNMVQYHVSKGLTVLRAAGIVEFEQQRTVHVYRIASGALADDENGQKVLEFGCCRFRFDRD
jgi:DNA-binding transcriptional ArsR family regulator